MPGSSPAAAEIFPFCTHNAVTQTVQIRGIVIATERIFDSRRLKKRTQKKQIKMSKLTCERSKKPLKKTVLAGNGLLQTNEIISSQFRRLTQLFCLDSTIFRIITALKGLIYI